MGVSSKKPRGSIPEASIRLLTYKLFEVPTIVSIPPNNAENEMGIKTFEIGIPYFRHHFLEIGINKATNGVSLKTPEISAVGVKIFARETFKEAPGLEKK